jgi:hypothetical protein
MSDNDKSILERLDNFESRLNKIESDIADDFKYSRTKRDVDTLKEIVGIK